MYAARPVGLIYYSNEFHVMDLKVINSIRYFKIIFFQPDQCSCHEISFGSVNDILTVSSNLHIIQPAAKETNCPQSELKMTELLTKDSSTIKVIEVVMIFTIS